MMLAIIPAVPVMIIMGDLRKGNFDIWNVIVDMSGATPVMIAMYGIFIGPFAILSIFNRFYFGKLLGVVTEDTLFLENREIPITDRRSYLEDVPNIRGYIARIRTAIEHSIDAQDIGYYYPKDSSDKSMYHIAINPSSVRLRYSGGECLFVDYPLWKQLK